MESWLGFPEETTCQSFGRRQQQAMSGYILSKREITSLVVRTYLWKWNMLSNILLAQLVYFPQQSWIRQMVSDSHGGQSLK